MTNLYEERYSISCDLHFGIGSKKRMVNHRTPPLACGHDGNVWLALRSVSLSASMNAGNIVLLRDDIQECWKYNQGKRHWVRKKKTLLNTREKDVLSLSAQGMTVKDISEWLCLSEDTVKCCKRALFRKLESENISAAIGCAANYRLL